VNQPEPIPACLRLALQSPQDNAGFWFEFLLHQRIMYYPPSGTNVEPQAMRKSPRFKTLACILILTGAVGLTGCSWFQFPGVYKLGIQQGNILTQEMVDQLQPGMTKRQVNFVLGTPLIRDSFEQDRWDYYYSFRDSEGETVKKRLTVFFENDQLTHLTGDYRPGATEESADS
jgi:outer membrane protein assembly factor BamE